MIIVIIIWIFINAAVAASVIFACLTLSRINRKFTSSKDFIKVNFYHTLLSFIVIILFYGLIIFYFDCRIYFSFYDYNVIRFKFLWQCFGLLLLIDRTYTKFWLDEKLNIPNLHVHNIDWDKEI